VHQFRCIILTAHWATRIVIGNPVMAKKKKRSPKAANAAPAPKSVKKQKPSARQRAMINGANVEESLDDLPDNVLLRIFIKAGYKGRLAAMQGLPLHPLQAWLLASCTQGGKMPICLVTLLLILDGPTASAFPLLVCQYCSTYHVLKLPVIWI